MQVLTYHTQTDLSPCMVASRHSATKPTQFHQLQLRFHSLQTKRSSNQTHTHTDAHSIGPQRKSMVKNTLGDANTNGNC